MTNRAIDYLRHRPPFLLIDQFELEGEGASASITADAIDVYSHCGVRGSLWFHAECSAQLFGCYCRATRDARGRPGYLTGFRRIERLRPGEPTTLQVREIARELSTRRYSAVWLDSAQSEVLVAEGAIAMPEEQTIARGEHEMPAAASNVPASVGRVVERSRDADGAVAEFQLEPNHPVYAGHFPGEPVTPGVLLGEAMSDLVGWASGGGTLTTISDTVFSARVGPSDLVRIRAKRNGDVFAATVFLGNKRAMRAKLHCD